jgi:hypothetical protein
MYSAVRMTVAGSIFLPACLTRIKKWEMALQSMAIGLVISLGAWLYAGCERCCKYEFVRDCAHLEFEWNSVRDGRPIAKRLRIDRDGVLRRLRDDCAAIIRRLCKDCAMITQRCAQRLRRDCESIAQGSQRYCAAIALRFRIDCTAIAKFVAQRFCIPQRRLGIDCKAVRSDCAAIAKR